MKELDYSEFCLWVSDNDDKVRYILGTEDWSVVEIEGHFYYYEHEVEGSSDTLFEVEIRVVKKGEEQCEVIRVF